MEHKTNKATPWMFIGVNISNIW